MEQNTQKSSIILKYAKRRYDGGPEIETIRSIEHQQVVSYLNKIRQEQAAENPATTTETQVNKPTAPQTEAQANRKSKMLHALVIGPVQVCIGLVEIGRASCRERV